MGDFSVNLSRLIHVSGGGSMSGLMKFTGGFLTKTTKTNLKTDLFNVSEVNKWTSSLELCLCNSTTSPSLYLRENNKSYILQRDPNMADGAVNFLLDKLTTLIFQKASLLGDVKDEVEDIKEEFESMRAFLKDADRREESNEGVGSWVRQVNDVAHDVEDIIDEFLHHEDKWRRRSTGINGIIHYTVNLPKIVITRHRIASKLHSIKTKVHEISERSKRYGFDKIDDRKISNEVNGWGNLAETALFVKEDEIVGMDENKKKLLLWLSEDEPRRTIISIVGMGGLGKTTLVTEVYNDAIVKQTFDCWAWISVSPNFRTEDLLLSLIKEFMDRDQVVVTRNLGSMNHKQLGDALFSYLSGKRYVIVLDDVWSIDLWSKLRCAFPNNGCAGRIILTTRNGKLATCIGTGSRVHHLEPLLEDDAWSLFCKRSFWRNQDRTCPPELKEIALVILKKCEGLPLAIVALGGLMSSRDQTFIEWKKVYDSLDWHISNSEMLSNVKAILLLGFRVLPYHLKHCFLYCSVFPDGYPIKRTKLIRLWVAEGFIEERKGVTMEEVAEDYLKELILRSMIHITETNDAGRVKTCRLHDFMRELALRTSEKQNFCINLGATDSRLAGRVRRLSMYNSGRNIQLSKSMSNYLRSFFFFETEMFPFTSLHHNLSHFKLLKVLDLQGVAVETLPGGLFSLVGLRYLNLRDTKLREIPKSIGSLQNLQTLDIRSTNVQRVPNELTKLSNLRHLYMYHYKKDCSKDFNFLCTMKAPLGICNLHSLQTLACLEADEYLVKQVGSLCELRRFQVTKLRACDGPKLCASIEKMNCLRYLGVMASNEEELLQLEELSPPTPLQKLILVGHLQRLPPWLSSLMNLTHLYLGWSRLGQDDDILSSLQVLSNLVFLELKKAYEGELLQFHAGFFPKLNKLNLWELARLKRVIIDEGALPSVRFLHLIRCEELKILPMGIEHLATLEKLHLQEMPEEFVQELQSDISEDRRNVRRISTVKHVFSTEHNCVVETLLY